MSPSSPPAQASRARPVQPDLYSEVMSFGQFYIFPLDRIFQTHPWTSTVPWLPGRAGLTPCPSKALPLGRGESTAAPVHFPPPPLPSQFSPPISHYQLELPKPDHIGTYAYLCILMCSYWYFWVLLGTYRHKNGQKYPKQLKML